MAINNEITSSKIISVGDTDFVLNLSWLSLLNTESKSIIKEEVDIFLKETGANFGVVNKVDLDDGTFTQQVGVVQNHLSEKNAKGLNCLALSIANTYVNGVFIFNVSEIEDVDEEGDEEADEEADDETVNHKIESTKAFYWCCAIENGEISGDGELFGDEYSIKERYLALLSEHPSLKLIGTIPDEWDDGLIEPLSLVELVNVLKDEDSIVPLKLLKGIKLLYKLVATGLVVLILSGYFINGVVIENRNVAEVLSAPAAPLLSNKRDKGKSSEVTELNKEINKYKAALVQNLSMLVLNDNWLAEVQYKFTSTRFQGTDDWYFKGYQCNTTIFGCIAWWENYGSGNYADLSKKISVDITRLLSDDEGETANVYFSFNSLNVKFGQVSFSKDKLFLSSSTVDELNEWRDSLPNTNRIKNNLFDAFNDASYLDASMAYTSIKSVEPTGLPDLDGFNELPYFSEYNVTGSSAIIGDLLAIAKKIGTYPTSITFYPDNTENVWELKFALLSSQSSSN